MSRRKFCSQESEAEGCRSIIIQDNRVIISVSPPSKRDLVKNN